MYAAGFWVAQMGIDGGGAVAVVSDSPSTWFSSNWFLTKWFSTTWWRRIHVAPSYLPAIEGTSKERYTVEGTSKERYTVEGTSQKRSDLSGG